MRYGPPGAPVPDYDDQGPVPGLDQEHAEAAARQMSRSSERPVLLPEEIESADDTEHETVRPRRQQAPSSGNRTQGAVFFFVAES